MATRGQGSSAYSGLISVTWQDPPASSISSSLGLPAAARWVSCDGPSSDLASP